MATSSPRDFSLPLEESRHPSSLPLGESRHTSSLPLAGRVGEGVTPGTYGGYAYFNGAVVPFEQANVSVGTHALHYGTGCFEGIQGYWNADYDEIYLLKLKEHYERFKKSNAL